MDLRASPSSLFMGKNGVRKNQRGEEKLKP